MKVIFESGSHIHPPNTLLSTFLTKLNSLVPPLAPTSFFLVTGFFFFATSLRWLIKSKKRNEFDVHENPIEICKFCQIIKKAQSEPGIVLY